MLDTVTVVFREELPVLRRQARSIELNCQHIGIKNIYVIVNDDDSVAQSIDTAWWGNLSATVKVVPRSTFGNSWVENGWVSQQALKLLASQLCQNAWYTVLDAKTIFVRPLLLSELFANNKLQVGQLPIYSVFEASRQITNQLFDIDLSAQAGPGGVPFFFNTNDAKAMIAYIEQKVKTNFAEWFQAQGMLTEFILYSGWIEYRHGLNNYLSQKPFFSVCNICHSELGIVDQKLSALDRPTNLTVSIHRNAWTQMSPQQQQQYLDFLEQRLK